MHGPPGTLRPEVPENRELGIRLQRTVAQQANAPCRNATHSDDERHEDRPDTDRHDTPAVDAESRAGIDDLISAGERRRKVERVHRPQCPLGSIMVGLAAEEAYAVGTKESIPMMRRRWP
jgi:hypothetical protein